LALDRLARTLQRAMRGELQRLLNDLTSHISLTRRQGDFPMVSDVASRLS
jgi:hypothetical protein